MARRHDAQQQSGFCFLFIWCSSCSLPLAVFSLCVPICKCDLCNTNHASVRLQTMETSRLRLPDLVRPESKGTTEEAKTRVWARKWRLRWGARYGKLRVREEVATAEMQAKVFCNGGALVVMGGGWGLGGRGGPEIRFEIRDLFRSRILGPKTVSEALLSI